MTATATPLRAHTAPPTTVTFTAACPCHHQPCTWTATTGGTSPACRINCQKEEDR